MGLISDRVANLGMALIPLLPVPFVAARYLTADTYLPVLIITVSSLFAGFFCFWKIIPLMAEFSLRRQICGMDINKKGTVAGEKKIPEALGLGVGMMHLTVLLLFDIYYSHLKTHSNALVEYHAALHSICFMLLLGFTDDVLDLPWRYKMLLPTVASLPLLVAYAGETTVVLPNPIHHFTGRFVDLGILYHVYLGLLAVFCSNSINIHAGINGLEAGQSYVIACAILIHNFVQLDSLSRDSHLMSIFIIIPFIAVTLALLKYNWFPSQVFVGDTFCYFAGMTFAVCGILAHFSKTLLLFFIPQLINFVYSLPQLLKIIPCPRHRLARFDPKTGLLHGVPEHMNLLNLTLRIVGPKTERQLVIILMIFQVLCCVFGFWVRYELAHNIYS